MIRSKIAMGFLWALLALVLHVWPGVVAPVHAQGSRKDDIVFNSRGIPLAGATVRVCAMPASGQPCTPLALIYSDAALTQALANPTATDGLGNYSFYAAPGKYEIEISGPGITTKQIPNVILPNDPSSPTFSGISAFSLNLSGNLTVNGNTSVIGNLASGTLNLTNQSTPPGAAGSGTVNLYTKTADKLLYYKDETGTETGPLGAGAQTNVSNNWPAQQNFNANQRFKGPNPYVDITAFGARTANPNLAPAAVGITANCTATNTQVTISSASTFVNGDGVVLYGCGAPQSMSTPSAPTVTPSLALNGTGTGITVVGPTGSTTYNYKIIARDKNGGLTAASTAATTTTGAASLGAQTVNITSMFRSNDVVTVTTASAHGFLVGCAVATCGEVFIGGGNGESDPSFRGWYLVSSAADTTHFTFTSGLDTRNGASTSATGGTATYYSCNHLTWTAVTGAWEYYFYSDRANPGTYALVGVSRPQGAANTDLTWDDFGSPMMDNFSFPPYVPTSPPSSATSDHLSTTISSGAGTTTLTLANAAGTTVSGATIRLDAAPGILAAATAINSGGAHAGTLLIPADNSGNTYVVNSYLNLSPFSVAISQAGPLLLNETFETKARWYGDRSPQYGNQQGAGAWQGNPVITVGTAIPGIYNPQLFATVLQGVALGGTAGNGSLLAFYEGGFNMSFTGDSFVTATGNNDYMGVGLYLRGSVGQSATNVIIDRTLFSTGGPSVDGATHTPVFYCNGCGQGQMRSAYHLHRGDIFNLVASGGSWKFDHAYINGGFTPLFTFTGGSNNWEAILGQITLDTFAHPCLVSFSQGTILFPQGACSPSSGVPPLTGLRNPVLGATSLSSSASPVIQNRDSMGPICQFGALDGLFGPNQTFYCVNANNAALATGTNYPIFVNGVAPAKPTCTVGAGGSLPVGTYAFTIVPVWQNGGEGSYAPTSTGCTTTTGNQTITISYSGVPGNPKGLDLYYCTANTSGCTGGFAASNTFSNPQPAGSSQFVWSSSSFNAGASPGSAVPTGGPTMLMPGTQGIATPALTLAGSSVNPPPSGFTATRNISFPDNSGVIPVSSYQNSAYDNATRANGAIGSNWTVTNNGINISSNNFVGTASSNDVAYWAVNAFSPAQFSQVTLTALNGTTDFPGTAVLLSGSGAATHGYNCVEDTTNIFIQKITGTSNTTLTSAATTGAAGDILRLEVDSSGNLTCFKNGVSTLTANDTTYTSGAPGLFLFGTVATSKNWSGGNLHPLSHLDTEQDWTKTQHFTQGIALGGSSSESFNNNPRAEQNVFLPGALTSTWTGSTWTTDRSVTITRVQVQAKTAPSGCTTNAVVRLTDGTTPVNVTVSAASNDSGAIAQNYAAGASLTVAVQTAAAGCTTSPADANVTVQYRMQ